MSIFYFQNDIGKISLNIESKNVGDLFVCFDKTCDLMKFENDIYSFVDVGILVRRRQMEDAFGNRVVRRYIDQVCFFTRENGQNQVKIVVDGGDVVIPPSVGRRGTYYETRAAAVG